MCTGIWNIRPVPLPAPRPTTMVFRGRACGQAVSLSHVRPRGRHHGVQVTLPSGSCSHAPHQAGGPPATDTSQGGQPPKHCGIITTDCTKKNRGTGYSDNSPLGNQWQTGKQQRVLLLLTRRLPGPTPTKEGKGGMTRGTAQQSPEGSC